MNAPRSKDPYGWTAPGSRGRPWCSGGPWKPFSCAEIAKVRKGGEGDRGRVDPACGFVVAFASLYSIHHVEHSTEGSKPYLRLTEPTDGR